MVKCTHCGELVTGDREVCLGCGRAVPNPDRPVERRLRAMLIAAFVLGGVLMIGQMIRDSLASP
ncbi:MAG: hypothetical protein JWL60_1820 [Gemmatimonadetes bacterium]|jgi:hypothetical protein|nr:hypothetical protein [Gemmatimonadota bacterium]